LSVKVRIPTPLRKLTKEQAEAEQVQGEPVDPATELPI
jgi:hypothetical protein